MRWRNAWIVMRKDLDEFTKQKLVIGSIVAMPIFLGVVLPLIMFVPLTTIVPLNDRSWDVPGLIEIGELQGSYNDPWTNKTINDTSVEYTVLQHVRLDNVTVHDCAITFCIIDHSIIQNSTIHHSTITDAMLINVAVKHSTGDKIDGRFILSVDSDLAFNKVKGSDLEIALPLMLNMVLMIFIIVPATLPTIIASYSIVGEKNNRSLEPLLATPTTDGEILAGKILSSFFPSMAATALAFVLSVGLIDVFLMPHLGYAPLPTLTWLMSILLLAPTACLMSILACVLISSKVSDVRAAQQVGGFVVMPVVVLMLSVLSGMILLSWVTIVIFAVFYMGIDIALFYFARAIFNRENILVKWT